MKLSKTMQDALVNIANAMPLAGDKSLALLPVKHGRTVQALEDRKLIKASTSNTGTGVRWTLTDAGWQEAARLELATKQAAATGTRELAARIADAVSDAPDMVDPEAPSAPQEREERLVCPDGQLPADCNFWHDHTGCQCPTPPWHNPTCPALPGILAADEAAATAKAVAADAQWAARNLPGSHRCQALKFEGHRCANVITCTVTTGEWMEITVWNMADEIDFTEVIRVDGKPFGGNPDGILIPGDMVLVNTVVRAWCGECAEEERKARDFGSVLIITPLSDGDHIPNGTSRYCVNGYNDAACDDFCGPDGHRYRVANLPMCLNGDCGACSACADESRYPDTMPTHPGGA